MLPLISILLPFKDEGWFLRDCLESIIAQTFEDWECILLNDHSTDNSESIALEFCALDQRFRLYQNQGHGIIEANVLGISLSSGKYITRMDGDDLMPPKKLELFYNAIKDKTAGAVVTGKVKFFPEENCGPGTKFYESWLNERCRLNDHHEQIWRECTLANPNWLMSKEDLLNLGGFKDYEYPEDYEMMLRVVLNGYNIESVHEVTHLWRQHGQRHSMTSEDYGTQKFMEMKWRFYKQTFANQNNQKLLILGNGKKSKILQEILTREWVAFTLLDHKKREESENAIKGLTPCEVKVISTLSGIDNHDDWYQMMKVKGIEFVKFC